MLTLADYLTTAEAAQELGIKQFAVTRAIQRGRTFKGVVRKGHFHLIPKTEVARVKLLRQTVAELRGNETK